MACYDFSTVRLFVTPDLAADAPFDAGRDAAHYLGAVLRRPVGAELLVFNGRDGEWRVRVAAIDRRSVTLRPLALTRAQTPLPDIDYLFAPLKHARLDYLVQKAVEMGAGRLRPVLTRRTVATRVNADRMRANVVEAAEQCGVLAVPSVHEAANLPDVLAALAPQRTLVFCDEDAPVANPLEALAGAAIADGLALVVGPEGGFTDDERALVLACPNVRRISLGPRILRADTAAVAALALVQGVLGDWRGTGGPA